MLEYGYYNMDCKKGMAEFPDKYFDLAVIDPPYGIKVDTRGRKKGRSKLAVAKDYKPFAGGDLEPPDDEYFPQRSRTGILQIGRNEESEKK